MSALAPLSNFDTSANNKRGPPFCNADVQSATDHTWFFHFSSPIPKSTFRHVAAVSPVQFSTQSRTAFPVFCASALAESPINASKPQPFPWYWPIPTAVGSTPRIPVIPDPARFAASRALTTFLAEADRNAQLSHALPATVHRNVNGVAVPTHSAAVTVKIPAASVRNAVLTVLVAFVVNDASAGNTGRGAPNGSVDAKYDA